MFYVMKKPYPQVVNFNRIKGARLFWSATLIFSLIVLFLPTDTNYDLRLKVLLILLSPLCVLIAFSVVTWINIFWSDLLLPILRAIRRLVKRK